ncbi:agmatinase [Robiginitalea sp. IMCC44478]|uniref:agmatinase n=1 Tax=Robiginitalea sp. IMCC44478 TaxID=3459122 RepID=UPI0040433F36
MEKIGIQGICYDAGSSFQQGPAKAPPLIRKALQSGAMNHYSEKGFEFGSNSIEELGDTHPKNYMDIYTRTAEHLKKMKKLITLGGDHSITYPIMKAYAEKYPKLAILQIDAHPDLYDHYEGDPHSHACPFARIMENKLCARLVQVGLRCFNPHQRNQAVKYGTEIIEMKDWMQGKLGPFNYPLYISLDLDALDPAYAPGVSHQEPGGFSSRQLINLIQGLDAEVVGADIVEYNPDRDNGMQTAYVAVKLLKELAWKINRGY